jgi:hypothetical protein
VRDPILFGGGDANLYAYVGNDPVNQIDPSGLREVGYEYLDYDPGAPFAHPAAAVAFGEDPQDNFDLVLTRLLNGLFGRSEWRSFVVYSHGFGTGALNTSEFNGGDVRQVAEWIRGQPGYRAGTAIRLNACYAGQNGGIAQSLSREMGASVSAPVGQIDLFGQGDDLPLWNVYDDGQLTGH